MQTGYEDFGAFDVTVHDPWMCIRNASEKSCGSVVNVCLFTLMSSRPVTFWSMDQNSDARGGQTGDRNEGRNWSLVISILVQPVVGLCQMERVIAPLVRSYYSGKVNSPFLTFFSFKRSYEFGLLCKIIWISTNNNRIIETVQAKSTDSVGLTVLSQN